MKAFDGNKIIVRSLQAVLISLAFAAETVHALDVAGLESLRVRQALYQMYQGRYADAQVDLAVSRDRGDISGNAEQELLNGILLYGAGLPAASMKILPKVADAEGANTNLTDLAWFHYAKAAKTLGDTEGVHLGLVSIRNALPGELEQERRFFQVNQLLAEDKLNEAAVFAGNMDRRSLWRAYAFYNQGVACLAKKMVDCAVNSMKSVGDLSIDAPELAALRDKSKVVMGFWMLSQNESRTALDYLRQVDIQGMYSTKAILGLGWAYAAREDYKAALRYWSELRGRDPLDTAVQEGILATGFAYNKLNSNPLALMHYKQAIIAYRELQESVESGISAMRAGDALGWLPVTMDDRALTKDLVRLNQLPDKRSVLRTLNDPKVREEYRQYRDLADMSSELQSWSEKIALYEEVLDERAKRQRERALNLRQRVKTARPEWLEQRFNVAQRTLITSDMARDGMAFARDTEVRQLQRLQTVYDKLQRIPAAKWPANAFERYSILRGVLMWNIYLDAENRRKEYSTRLAVVEQELHQTKELWQRMELLSNVDQMPVAKLKKRLASIRERLKAMSAKVAAAKGTQGGRFTRLVAADLEENRQHVTAYLAQAQYAVAKLFDEATASGVSP